MWWFFGALFAIFILLSFFNAKKRSLNSGQNLKIAEETMNIAINELGIPHDYYTKTIIDKKKWEYVRGYAEYLKNNGNKAEAVLLKSNIKDVNVTECSWPKLLAFGIKDLYDAEKPYIDMNERLMKIVQKD